MKRILTVVLIAALLLGVMSGSALANSPSIAHGKINKSTDVYWWKNEAFPVIKHCFAGEEYDVYEYDEDWVLILVDVLVTQGTRSFTHSFYGYIHREDVTCDPPLPEGSSPAADKGPNRRVKKPKTSAAPSAQESEQASSEPTQEPSAQPTEPTPTVEDQEEFDWIIRTPGCCSTTIDAGGGLVCSITFSFMAQKVGGTAPSSDPTYNHGMHTPYAATMYYSVINNMSDNLESWGLASLVSGSGSTMVDIKAPSARFYLDTGAQDFALVNFSVPAVGNAAANPKITSDSSWGSANMTFKDVSMAVPIQLKKAGSGYQFVLKNMRPGGGDMTFPAVLEKAFTDEDRWQRAADDADRVRQQAEKQRQQMEKQAQDQARKNASEAAGQDEEKESQDTQPWTAQDENGNTITLAPAGTQDPLAPLSTEDPLAPLSTEDPLAPLEPSAASTDDGLLASLTPDAGETVDHFPGSK